MVRKGMLALAMCMLVAGITVTARASDEVIVDEYIGIPAPLVDVITEAPVGDYLWVPGYWERDADDWDWVAGRWEIPPTNEAYWVNGYWKWEHSKWHWASGHWAIADSGMGWVVDEYIDIPDKLTEERPTKPSEANRWVPGHWDWQGRWYWIPGYWTTVKDPMAQWIDGHWRENFESGNWYWIGGHWVID